MSRLNVVWTLLVSLGVVCLVAAGYAMGVSLFKLAIYSMSLYGLFAILHFALQMVFASRSKAISSTFYRPTVSVVIPTYKEEPDMLRQCLTSVANQDYPKVIQVILSNDGDDRYIEDIFNEVSNGRSDWVYLHNGHKGKRNAMYSGFGVARGDIVVCIDSDTIIQRDAVRQIVGVFMDPRVGCATGNVRVLNYRDNLLTWVTNLRYWLAFNLERSAQGFHGVMSCVSGPFGAYRREVIEKVKDRWLNQTFLGNPCTFGDDRHLTNLVLSLGYKSVYVPGAVADTQSPNRLLKWLQQQLRWSRSFWREFILNARWFHKLNPWLAFDLTYQAVFPLFLLTNVAIIIYLLATESVMFLALWVSLILFFGLVRSLYGAIRTRNAKFLAFLFYGFLYVGVLLPLKLYALATVWKTTWGTKPTPVGLR